MLVEFARFRVLYFRVNCKALHFFRLSNKLLRGGRAFLGLVECPSATMGCCFSIIFVTSINLMRLEYLKLKQIPSYLTLTVKPSNFHFKNKKHRNSLKIMNCCVFISGLKIEFFLRYFLIYSNSSENLTSC